jgi:hypothetical protein
MVDFRSLECDAAMQRKAAASSVLCTYADVVPHWVWTPWQYMIQSNHSICLKSSSVNTPFCCIFRNKVYDRPTSTWKQQLHVRLSIFFLHNEMDQKDIASTTMIIYSENLSTIVTTICNMWNTMGWSNIECWVNNTLGNATEKVERFPVENKSSMVKHLPHVLLGGCIINLARLKPVIYVNVSRKFVCLPFYRFCTFVCVLCGFFARFSKINHETFFRWKENHMEVARKERKNAEIP